MRRSRKLAAVAVAATAAGTVYVASREPPARVHRIAGTLKDAHGVVPGGRAVLIRAMLSHDGQAYEIFVRGTPGDTYIVPVPSGWDCKIEPTEWMMEAAK